MSQTSYSGKVSIHPSEAISVSGKTEKGRELTIYLSAESIETLQKVFRFSAMNNDMHLGHAFWHIKENISIHECSSCKVNKKIWLQTLVQR